MLTDQQTQRYQRHLSLPKIGEEGQKRLLNAKVLCVGAGGLASPLLLYLAAAGVGTIGIVDADKVALSNLQRQILFSNDDLNQNKVSIAQQKLQRLNEDINIITYPFFLKAENAIELIQQYDIVADTSDNFATRYLVNDACFHCHKPLVHASVLRFSGMCSTFIPGQTGCYRCLFPRVENPINCPSCSEAGVLGIVPGVLGCLQACEIMKWILQAGDLLTNRLLHVDLLSMHFKETKIQPDPDCIICSNQKDFFMLHSKREDIMVKEVTVKKLKAMLDNKEDFILLDVREPHEYQICHINGKLIPLGELPKRVKELDPSKKTIIHCRSGGRSYSAAEFLMKSGFKDVSNLKGGILAWIDEIDSSLQKY